MNDDLSAALASSNVKAFLRVIRAGESSQDDDAYRMIVGGGLVDSFDDHPRRLVYIPNLKVSSSAAGAYQFLSRTWDECAKALELPDFSPASQDLAAVFLIRRRGALDDVIAGRVELAIRKCAREWASLPGSPYGQPMRTLQQALTTYAQYGGTLTAEPEPAPPTQKDTTMPLPAVLAALLPSLISSIPTLGKLFGSGSEVAERNVKAAELAVKIAQDALGAKSAQEAVETVQRDPVAQTQVREAIEARWLELTEAGGDGIAGARKADAAAVASGEPPWKSPSFIIALALLPLVYLVAGAVVGLFGAPFSEDVRAAIANGIVGLVVGAVAGYYFGQTTTRNRTPAP